MGCSLNEINSAIIRKIKSCRECQNAQMCLINLPSNMRIQFFSLNYLSNLYSSYRCLKESHSPEKSPDKVPTLAGVPVKPTFGSFEMRHGGSWDTFTHVECTKIQSLHKETVIIKDNAQSNPC